MTKGCGQFKIPQSCLLLSKIVTDFS